jgi:RNA polymerase sigma-70 factor (ECF subfamily)
MTDDPGLVERARRDPEAFAALYREYLPRVYRYLYRRVGSIPDTEDLTAQVFTEALEGLLKDRFRAGGCFPAWLFTIARRRAVDFYRQHSTDPLEDPPSPEPGLLVAVEKADDLGRLARLLAQLDEQKQELLRLRYAAGLRFAEIVLLEGRSEAAVKMELYRALDFLREQREAEHG